MPLAASCGKSRIDNGPPALPPAYISNAINAMSPAKSASSKAGKGRPCESRCTHQKVRMPYTKYRPAVVMKALGARIPTE